LISFFEKYGLGVCERIAKKIGLRVNYLRFFFFYLSIFTLLIGFILYLTIAALFWAKDKIIHRKKTPFDL